MASKQAIELAAQAWCKPSTSHLVMDVELAEAFAEILDKEWNKLYPVPGYVDIRHSLSDQMRKNSNEDEHFS